MRISIPIAKCNRSVDIDTERLVNGNADDMAALDRLVNAYRGLHYLIFNGAKQSLNDGHAGKTPDVAWQLVQKKLARIHDATIKTRGDGTPRETDPVAAEIKRRTIAWWKKEGGKKAVDDARAQYPGLAKKTDQEIAVALMNAFMNAPETIAAAKAMVAAKSMKVNVKLNLSDFGMAEPDESDDDEVLMIEDQSDDDESDDDDDDSNDE